MWLAAARSRDVSATFISIPQSLSLKRSIGNFSKTVLGVCLLNSTNNPNWMANSYLLLHFPSWIRAIFKRRWTQMSTLCMSFTAPLSAQPEFLTIMPRQQLLLPVILYDWFSHTIWLSNNSAEDIKRTPAPSYHHHCQWASVPTVKKKREAEMFDCVIDGLRWVPTVGSLVSGYSNTLIRANTLAPTNEQLLHAHALHCVHGRDRSLTTSLSSPWSSSLLSVSIL